MDKHYISSFIRFLSQDQGRGPLTIKNYRSDVERLLHWCEKRNINLENITPPVLDSYFLSISDALSLSTLNRHKSSLRKYFYFLFKNNHIISNPTDIILSSTQEVNYNKEFFLDIFSNELKSSLASRLTIKNYTIDVKSFINWIFEVSGRPNNLNDNSFLLSNLSRELINEYILRLSQENRLLQSSIQRRKSALNKYYQILIKYNKISQVENEPDISKSHSPDLSIKETDYIAKIASLVIDKPAYSEDNKSMSSLPPLRVLNTIAGSFNYFFDSLISKPLAEIIYACQIFFWEAKGSNIFEKNKNHNTLTTNPIDNFIVQGPKTSLHSPVRINYRNEHRFFNKLYLLISQKRPKWYKKYHSYRFAHYAHFATLVLVTTVFGSYAFQAFISKPTQSVLGTNFVTSPGRTLMFSGTLLDSNKSPITNTTSVEFGIYADSNSTKSAKLWTENQIIKPDSNGSFYIRIGSSTPIPNYLFSNPDPIFLGIRIGHNEELLPRQQIPNVNMSDTSRNVSGLYPITSDGAGSRNVLLALDSSGNLNIGDNSSPTFQASGGQLTLKGKSLALTTMTGSNGDILLEPDGLGKVYISKPIQNISEYGERPLTIGAVTVEDTFAILSSDNRAALAIYQEGSGNVLTASNSSDLVFSIDNTGNGYLANNLAIQGGEIKTNKFSTNIFNQSAGIINFGGEAIALTIGSHSGTTTIRNATLAINGNQTIAGTTGTTYSGNNAGIIFSGSGNHNITAASGILTVGSSLLLNKDVSITPQTNDGVNNLGSSSNPFDTIYVNNIISSSLNGTTNYWTILNNSLIPINTSNDISIGYNSLNEPAWKVFGDGSNKGTASSSGNLSFTSGTTKINSLNNSDVIFQTSPGGDTELTPRLILTNSGNIGIGITNPQFLLDVSSTSTATSVAMITNIDTGINADALTLKVGNALPGTNNSFLTFLNGNGEVIGKVQGNSSGGVSFATTGSDIAEYFPKNNPVEYFETGHLVCLHQKGGVTKCSKDSTAIVGVVTDRPGFIGGSSHQDDPSYLLVGISGQIPLLVSSEKGEINPSDPLTYSSEDGIATKATEDGYIVGRSLQETPNSSGLHKVTAFIQPMWYSNSQYAMTEHGDLQLGLQTEQSSSTALSMYNINSILSAIRNNSSSLSPIINAFSKEIISVGTLVINSAIINVELIAKRITSDEIFATEKIVSPLITTDRLLTSVISPLAEDEGLSIIFKPDGISMISQDSSEETLVEFDKSGNTNIKGVLSSKEASISGELSANSATINSDATIAGTLRVKRLLADEIISNSASSSATYITNVTNIYSSSQSSTIDPKVSRPNKIPETIDPQSLIASELSSTFKDLPESSISFKDSTNQTVGVDRLKVINSLLVFGPASLSNVFVSDQLSIGKSLTLAQNSINVIGGSLSLQSLRQGSLDFMGGLISIDTSGNLTVNGDVFFAKNLTVAGDTRAATIKPIPDQDINIDIGNDSKKPDSFDSKLLVKNASNGAILQVNKKGDLTASGSGSFITLLTKQLHLVRSAQADTSVTKTIASSSAGTATISKGQRERTIITPFVTESSLIYLTPTSETYGFTPYIARQSETILPGVNKEFPDGKAGSFTIQITNPVQKDINLNWWVIN